MQRWRACGLAACPRLNLAPHDKRVQATAHAPGAHLCPPRTPQARRRCPAVTARGRRVVTAHRETAGAKVPQRRVSRQCQHEQHAKLMRAPDSRRDHPNPAGFRGHPPLPPAAARTHQAALQHRVALALYELLVRASGGCWLLLGRLHTTRRGGSRSAHCERRKATSCRPAKHGGRGCSRPLREGQAVRQRRRAAALLSSAGRRSPAALKAAATQHAIRNCGAPAHHPHAPAGRGHPAADAPRAAPPPAPGYAR